MSSRPQDEPQSERAAVQLTRGEKADLRLVSITMEITESQLLRDCTVAEIVERAAEIRRRIAVAAPTGSAA